MNNARSPLNNPLLENQHRANIPPVNLQQKVDTREVMPANAPFLQYVPYFSHTQLLFQRAPRLTMYKDFSSYIVSRTRLAI